MRACVGLALVGLMVATQGACSSSKSNGDTSKDGGSNGQIPSYDMAADGGTLAPLAQVTIVEIAAFQATKAQIATTVPIGPVPIAPVPLGPPSQANAPVVALRPGQIRVYVDPTNGGNSTWTPHPLIAELDVFDSSGNPLVPPMGTPTHIDEQTIMGVSTDGDLGSTFNFLMNPQDLPAGAQFTVTIRDKTAAAGSDSDVTTSAIYPLPGMGNNGADYQDMNVQSSGAAGFQYEIVPLQYLADGSGRLPDLTSATLDSIKDELMQFYPVDQVTYTVHAPFPWTGNADERPIPAIPPAYPATSGWDDVFVQIQKLHDEIDHAPSNVWYVATFEPGDNFDDYCVDGCVLGEGIVGDVRPTNRVAAIVGYGLTAADTLPQELAHSLGELHAPCPYQESTTQDENNAPPPGTLDVHWPSGINDPNGPLGTAAVKAQSALWPSYQQAQLGQWGYDVFTRILLDPGAQKPAVQYRDYMSYCGSPTYTVWTSDYTFNNMFNEIRSANAMVSAKIEDFKKIPLTTYRYVNVGADGAFHWGTTVHLEYEPGGTPFTATYVAADGHAMATGNAMLRRTDHSAGVFLLPEGPAGFAELRIDGVRGIKTNRLVAEKK